MTLSLFSKLVLESLTPFGTWKSREELVTNLNQKLETPLFRNDYPLEASLANLLNKEFVVCSTTPGSGQDKSLEYSLTPKARDYLSNDTAASHRESADFHTLSQLRIRHLRGALKKARSKAYPSPLGDFLEEVLQEDDRLRNQVAAAEANIQTQSLAAWREALEHLCEHSPLCDHFTEAEAAALAEKVPVGQRQETEPPATEETYNKSVTMPISFDDRQIPIKEAIQEAYQVCRRLRVGRVRFQIADNPRIRRFYVCYHGQAFEMTYGKPPLLVWDQKTGFQTIY